MWQKKHLQYKQLCGCIVIGTWFFFVPACFRDSLTSALRMFIKVPYPFLKGIVDISVLIGVCLLCGYPFLADKITKAGIRKQIQGGSLLFGILLLCSLPFVTYTWVYQETMPFLQFMIYQILCIGFTEELLFRGFLRWVLQTYISSEMLVIVLCALLFSLAHIGSEVFSMLQLLTSFMIGGVFTAPMIKLPDHYSIYSLAILHGCFNVLILGFTTYMQTL